MSPESRQPGRYDRTTVAILVAAFAAIAVLVTVAATTTLVHG